VDFEERFFELGSLASELRAEATRAAQRNRRLSSRDKAFSSRRSGLQQPRIVEKEAATSHPLSPLPPITLKTAAGDRQLSAETVTLLRGAMINLRVTDQELALRAALRFWIKKSNTKESPSTPTVVH
jgi:hypothetical protein